MELSPVTRTSASGVTLVARGSAGAKADLPEVHAPAPQQSLPPPATLVGATTEVEFSRHQSGVTTVKFYDKKSGAAIDQFPIESVLNAVTSLIELVRRTA